jgi:ATP-dependent Clp protease adaptor protein ClpS
MWFAARPSYLSGSPRISERLSHVAVNVHSHFVRSGACRAYRSPDEQRRKPQQEHRRSVDFGHHQVKPKTKRPNLYRVLILNDDYTPMEFVVHVLEKFFQKDAEAATKIMLHVHHHGVGECGVFTYEIAETKVTQVMDFARKHQHPLQCVMEKK